MTVPTKRKLAQAFTIRGQLRHESRTFIGDSNADMAAHLQLFADIEYKGRLYEDIVLLTLEIEGHMEDGWHVMDEFTHVLPYRKPVAAFRQYLIQELTRIRDTDPKVDNRSPSCPLWMGIGTYIRELEKFDELQSLAGQACNVTRFLQHEVRATSKFPNAARRADLEVRILKIIREAGKLPSVEELFKVIEQ